MAENSQQFGSRAIIQRGVGEVQIISNEQKEIKSSLLELTSLVKQMALNSASQNSTFPVQVMEVCGICSSHEHTSDFCPNLHQDESVAALFRPQNQQKYDPNSSTYNPGWKDHPNLRYGNSFCQQPASNQFQQQAFVPNQLQLTQNQPPTVQNQQNQFQTQNQQFQPQNQQLSLFQPSQQSSQQFLGQGFHQFPTQQGQQPLVSVQPKFQNQFHQNQPSFAPSNSFSRFPNYQNSYNNSRMEEMMQQLVQQQQMYLQQQQNQSRTDSALQNLERQMGQLANNINQLQAQSSSQLPSQTTPNPKGNVSALTLRSGKTLTGPNQGRNEGITDSVSAQKQAPTGSVQPAKEGMFRPEIDTPFHPQPSLVHGTHFPSQNSGKTATNQGQTDLTNPKSATSNLPQNSPHFGIPVQTGPAVGNHPNQVQNSVPNRGNMSSNQSPIGPESSARNEGRFGEKSAPNSAQKHSVQPPFEGVFPPDFVPPSTSEAIPFDGSVSAPISNQNVERNKNQQGVENSIPLPFPQRKVQSRKNVEEEKAREFQELVNLFSKVEVNVPLLTMIKQIPKYAKFIKDLCVHKKKLKGNELISMGKNISALIRQVPKKCEDPGVFTVPCVIGSCLFEDAMLDLGASINVMPKSVFQTLGIGPLQPTGVVIQLANRSQAHPAGVIEDVLVKVRELIFPADFYILDMEGDYLASKAPLILGRPFLKTARTKIDVHAGTLSMEIADTVVQFSIFDAMKHPTEDHSILSIDISEELDTVDFLTELDSDIDISDPHVLGFQFEDSDIFLDRGADELEPDYCKILFEDVSVGECMDALPRESPLSDLCVGDCMDALPRESPLSDVSVGECVDALPRESPILSVVSPREDRVCVGECMDALPQESLPLTVQTSERDIGPHDISEEVLNPERQPKELTNPLRSFCVSNILSNGVIEMQEVSTGRTFKVIGHKLKESLRGRKWGKGREVNSNDVIYPP